MKSRARTAPVEILRFQQGHTVELYDRGREALDVMLEAIDAATQTIHLETYIFRSDEIGRRFLSSLEAKANSGVSVRMILDAVGSRGIDTHALHRLGEAGCEVTLFNPPASWLWRFRPRQRDHRKILVVDGRVGFLGGLNIGDEYAHEDEAGPTWRDAHIRLEGPAINELQALFVENWFRSGGEGFEWRELLTVHRPPTGDLSVAILADGPTYRRRRVRSVFVEELRRARSHVLLVSPYFAPGSRVLDALAEARDRGVDVEILLAGASDHPILRRAVRAIIPKLVHRGVRVYEDPHRMMHAKLAVFDESLAVVGTSNLDRQSLEHSCEVNAVFEGPEVGTWIREHFGTNVYDVTPIDKELLQRRSIWTRSLDRIAAFWAKL